MSNDFDSIKQILSRIDDTRFSNISNQRFYCEFLKFVVDQDMSLPELTSKINRICTLYCNLIIEVRNLRDYISKKQLK